MSIVWQLSIISFKQNMHVIEGVLVSGKRFSSSTPKHRVPHVIETIRSYLRRPISNQEIEIRIDNNTYQCFSQQNGNFSLWISDILSEKGQHAIFVNDKKLNIQQTTQVRFPVTSGNLSIISDIDDTILISHTLNHFKRIFTTVGKQAHKRRLVPYTQQLLNYLSRFNPNVYYVSRSEKNLFKLLSETIAHHNVLRGPLFLTPFLRWYQLLKPNKPRDHKRSVISNIIKQSEDKDFILIGDDSQYDMQVYLEIIRQYKSRIKMVFIRQIKPIKTNEQVKNWQAIIDEDMPGIYYQAFDSFNPNLLTPLL